MAYNPDNVFARILRGEIPCNKVYEDEYALAFHDVNPQAPVHVLIIPKGAFESHREFAAGANDAEVASLHRAIGKTAEITGLAATGYRLISNCGANAGQEVPHYHIHMLGGRALGPMLVRL